MTVPYIEVAKYHDICAGDTPRGQPNAMAVAQKPIFRHELAPAGVAGLISESASS